MNLGRDSGFSMIALTRIRDIVNALRRERFFFIAPVTLGVIFMASLGAYYLENGSREASIRSLWDGIWWAFVTICTVGYGDKVPLSDGGKVIGIFLMISGIGLLSMLTATVASVLVEQKMKEGKGLESIREKGHIVICGWNDYTEEVILGLVAEEQTGDIPIVFINELSVDEIDVLKSKYGKYHLTFLRGDFIHEEVLKRANIGKAQIALVMADLSGNHPKERADDRTILAALVIKSLAPRIKAIAELLDGANKSHLRRANVDEIIVRGEHVGSLLASAIKSPGLSKIYSGLLSAEGTGLLRREEIPRRFVGRTFQDLADYYRTGHRAILIGFLKETQGMTVADLLSDDASALDGFIRDKLRESKKALFKNEDALKVLINPGNDYGIKGDDYAVIIAPAGFKDG